MASKTWLGGSGSGTRGQKTGSRGQRVGSRGQMIGSRFRVRGHGVGDGVEDLVRGQWLGVSG